MNGSYDAQWGKGADISALGSSALYNICAIVTKHVTFSFPSLNAFSYGGRMKIASGGSSSSFLTVHMSFKSSFPRS